MSSPESLQPKIEKNKSQSEYLNELRNHEHILEVREGDNIDVAAYTVDPQSRDTFLVKETLESIIRYLNCALVRDDFEVHKERVAWYGEMGILEKFDSELYFNNKLRLNKISGPHTWLEHLVSERTMRRFNNPDFFADIVPEVTALEEKFTVYGQGTVAENVEYVGAYEVLLRKVLNAMIEHGLVNGPKV